MQRQWTRTVLTAGLALTLGVTACGGGERSDAPRREPSRNATPVPAADGVNDAVVAAALTYLFGLGGAYAPTNGDEMVYIHIARMTAESGHWLPLQSEIIDTRNTKPPLLFWQAIAAGD